MTEKEFASKFEEIMDYEPDFKNYDPDKVECRRFGKEKNDFES